MIRNNFFCFDETQLAQAKACSGLQSGMHLRLAGRLCAALQGGGEKNSMTGLFFESCCTCPMHAWNPPESSDRSRKKRWMWKARVTPDCMLSCSRAPLRCANACSPRHSDSCLLFLRLTPTCLLSTADRPPCPHLCDATEENLFRPTVLTSPYHVFWPPMHLGSVHFLAVLMEKQSNLIGEVGKTCVPTKLLEWDVFRRQV